MTSAAESAEALKKEAAQKLTEAERLLRLQAEFPDLKKYVGRWNKVAYYSKSVNDKVTDYESRHNCGCCNDSPLEVWPYVETPDGRVYSDPPSFMVGERVPVSYGDRAYPGWEKKLLDVGISGAVVERVSHLMSPSDSEGEEESDDG